MDKLKIFTYLRPGIDAYAKSNDSKDISSKYVQVGFTLVSSALFLGLSVLFFIIFLFYYFCRFCRNLCRCCKGEVSGKDLKELPTDGPAVREDKKKKRDTKVKNLEHITRPCRKKCVAVTSIILTVFVIGLGVAWAVTMFKAINGVKKSSCSVFYTFENIKEGVDDPNIKFKFGGLSGMKYMMTEL